MAFHGIALSDNVRVAYGPDFYEKPDTRAPANFIRVSVDGSLVCSGHAIDSYGFRIYLRDVTVQDSGSTDQGEGARYPLTSCHASPRT